MKKIVYLTALLLVVCLASCKKNNKNTRVDYAFGVEISSDYVSAQHLIFALTNTYFKAIYDSSLMASGNASIDGAKVNYYPDSVYQLHIFYPEWGSDDGYGNWRQGEILVKADSGFFNQMYNAELSFSNFNFTKDTIQADGFVFKYRGEVTDKDLFNLIVTKLSRNFEDTTGVIYCNADMDIEVIESDSLNLIHKAEYLLISGKLDGICRNGNEFSTETNEAFMSDLSCNWMKSGNVSVNFATVDYVGNIIYSDTSICDNWYKLMIDDIDFPSLIQKPKWVK